MSANLSGYMDWLKSGADKTMEITSSGGDLLDPSNWFGGKEGTPSTGLLENPLVLGGIAVALVGGVYLMTKKKKK